MKKILYIFIFNCAFHLSHAQQLAQYTYFTYNYLLYNPAVTGTTPCIDLKVGTRRQWTGVEGSPTSNFLYAHGRIGKESKLKVHGIGGLIETDRAGPFNNVGLTGSYAFHKKISKSYFMAGGISFGIYQYAINYAALKFENQLDETSIEGSINSLLFPYANFGLWLYNRNKFFGLSVRSIGSPIITGVEGSNLQRHITFASGFTKRISQDLTFKPAFLINYVAKSKASIEMQGMMNYRDLFDLGLAARSGHGISALIKLSLIDHVTVVYSYDFTINKMKFASPSTHEVTIGLRSCRTPSKYAVPCSAYN